MVTYNVKKIMSKKWWQRVHQWLSNFLIPWLWHQVIKSGYNDPSKYKCWKLFRATLSRGWEPPQDSGKNQLHWCWSPGVAYSMAICVVYFFFVITFTLPRKFQNTEPYPHWLKIHFIDTHFGWIKIWSHSFGAAILRKILSKSIVKPKIKLI